MPYTLPPLSRRRFLQGSLVAAAGLALAPVLRAAEATSNPDRLLLLSDVHIAANPELVVRNVRMFDHLKQAVEEVLASDLHPSAGFINGDLAYSTAEAGDYATLIKLLKPLREAGLPMHLGLGNHDNFQRFRDAFPKGSEETGDPVSAKQVLVVQTKRANFFQLDSLDRTSVTPGILGAAQLEWLAKSLDARKDKPAILFVHHNLAALPTTTGLTDTDKLYEVILPRKQVKSVVFGHTHKRSATKVEDVHLINLPAVAYPFDGKEPIGWTDLLLTDTAGTFTFHCLDKASPKHGEKWDLVWRQG
jgi:3',5'-cyclic AMP phosphodiesterase CpdA